MQFIYYTGKSTPRECPGFFSFGKGQDRRAEVLGEGAATPCHQLRVLGERCELPSGVRGGAPIAQRFPHYFSTQGRLCRHYNITVDCSAAIGGKTPCPLAYSPLQKPLRH